MEPTNPREDDAQNLEENEPTTLTEKPVNEEQPSEVNQNEDDQNNNTAPNDSEKPEEPQPVESNPEEAEPVVQETNEEPPSENIEQEEQPASNEPENVETAAPIDEEANLTQDKNEENLQEELQQINEEPQEINKEQENQEIENEAPKENEQQEQPVEEAKPADDDQIEEEKIAEDQIEEEEEEEQPQEDNDESFESGDAQEEEEEEEGEEESNRDGDDQEEETIQEEKERQEGENKDVQKEGAEKKPGEPERRRPGRLPNKLKAQLAQKEAPIQTMSEAEKIYYSMESAKRFNNKLLANRLKLKDHMKQIEKARFVEDLPIEIASASFPSCFVPVYMYDNNGNEHFSMNQATQVERTSMVKFKKMNIENEGATLVPEQFNILGMGPNRRFQRRKKRRPVPVQRNSEDSD